MACRDKRILHSDHHKRKKRQTYQLSQTGPARMCSFNPNKAKIVWNLCTCEAQRPTESTITLLSFNLDAHSINATAEFQVTPGMCQLQHMDLSRNRNPGCSLAPQHPIGWNKLEGFCTKIARQPREWHALQPACALMLYRTHSESMQHRAKILCPNQRQLLAIGNNTLRQASCTVSPVRLRWCIFLVIPAIRELHFFKPSKSPEHHFCWLNPRQLSTHHAHSPCKGNRPVAVDYWGSPILGHTPYTYVNITYVSLYPFVSCKPL